MKANTKYTVAELITEAGYKPEDVVGKVRVRIGGIPVNDPAKVITFQPEVKKVEVIVGTEAVELEVEGVEKVHTISEGARASLDAEGVETSKQVEAMQKAKAEANKTDEEEIS